MKIKNFRFGLLCAWAFCALQLSAQQLPNYDFATAGGTWNGATQVGSWNISNVYQNPLGMDLKFNFGEWQQGTGRNGSNAAYIYNKEVGAATIKEEAPGYMALGQPFSEVKGLSATNATAGTTGGIDFTYRPDTMSVVLKRGGDANNFFLVFYSWNKETSNTRYMSKGGECLEWDTKVNEESDIRYQFDKNDCWTGENPNSQVGEGSYNSTESFPNEWREIKVPIKYVKDEKPTMANVILSAGNYPNKRASTGNTKGNYILVDQVKLIYSSKIHEIRLNGTPMSGFDVNKTEYTYELAKGAGNPTITCSRSGRTLSGSEISINYGTAGDASAPTTITVSAEDGSSTTTYTIHFVYERSKNSQLAGLSVNGTAISGFAPNVTNYNVSLPFGTSEFPTIEYVKGDATQSVEIVECAIPGTAKVIVTAENPDYTTTYNINLTQAELSDTTLKDIQVNGVSIEGFSPTKLSYTVKVPTGTTQDPVITYTSAYADGAQTIVLVNNGLNGTSTITVSAPGASSSRVYKISYNITASSYCYLKNIYLDGEPLEGFAPATFAYSISLPASATSVPAITYDRGDDYQTVTVEDGGVDGTTTIRVVAQNGTNSAIYRLNFSVNKSTNSKLSAIYLDGSLLENFAADRTQYSVSLPIGTTSLPTITWDLGDEYQTVTPTYGGVNGDTKLLVTAQSGARTQYVITFSVERADVSTLNAIYVGGELVPGFVPSTTEYNITLPVGTTVLPDITYTVHDEYQTVTVDRGSVNGTTRITVRAQSGSVTVYYLNFTVDLSVNTRLSDIQIGGQSIEDFEPDKAEYSYELPAGTVELPTITAVKGDDYQTVTISRAGVNGVTQIYVQAQNGDSFTYSIAFSVKKSENAFLNAIYVGGEALEGFDANTFNYSYTLAEGASACPAVTVEKGDASQSVQIIAPALEGRASITVSPEDGDANIYTIDFAFARSSNANLADLKVDGVSINGFAADNYAYSYELASGTVALPSIEAVKAEDSQTVEVLTNGVNGTTTVTVVAESGASQVYSIAFSTAKSAVADIESFTVGDYAISLQSGVYEYNLVLPEGTTALPAVSIVKADGQSVLTTSVPVLEGAIVATLVSEDGQTSNIYTVNVSVAKNSSTVLKSLKVGGTDITLVEGTFEYSLDLAYGFAKQSVEFEKGNEMQSVFVTNNRDKITLIVLAEDGTSATYVVNLNEQQSTNALLAGLQIYDANLQQFADVQDFAADKYEYSYALANLASDVPVVNPIPADDKQTITIVYGKPDAETTINVVAADGSTADYKISFITEKSDNASLANIYIAGEELGNYSEGFSADVTTYSVTLPYDMRSGVPSITYDKGHVNQIVELVYGATLADKSVITVTAEDGVTTKSYELSFAVDYSGKENVLVSVFADGNPLNFDKDDASGNFVASYELAYGAAVPAVTYVKSYEEQTVLVANQGISSAELTVKSNVEGVEDAKYVINYTQAPNPAVLSAIMVDGQEIGGFAKDKFKYIYTVPSGGSTPTVEFKNLEGQTVAATTSNVNYAEVVNTVGEQSLTYSVYFHYTDDVIPNGDFSAWSGTTYNGAQKPTGWTAPADCAEKLTVFGTFRTGNEVQKVSSGSSVYARLETRYHANMAGSLPGMMTTGDMSVTLKTALGGYSTSSVDGGIQFRNTPDVVSVDYNPQSFNTSNSSVTGWRMLADYYDASNVLHSNLFAEDYDEKTLGNWSTASLTVPYADEVRKVGVNKFNFTLNSANSENANSFKTKTGSTSVLFVDNLRAVYSSAISSLTIAGIQPTIVDGVYTVLINDANFYGLPVVEVNGQVPDQSYDVKYGDEVVNGNYMVRDIVLTSYAEDGSNTTYNLQTRRPVYTKLTDIKVNGSSIENFDSDTQAYTIDLPAGTKTLPDVEAVTESSYQNVVYRVEGNTYAIAAWNENGTTTIYTVTFNITKSDVVTLADISLNGTTVEGFAADNNNYSVTLAEGVTTTPELTFTKGAEGQVVEVVESANGYVLTVYAESDVDKASGNVYEVSIAKTPLSTTTKQLSALWIDQLPAGASQLNFTAETRDYSCSRAQGTKLYSAYAKEYADDALTVVLSDDKVTYTLYNANSTVVADDVVYTLEFVDVPETSTKLAGIKVNEVELADFNEDTFAYSVELNSAAAPVVEGIAANENQVLTGTYNAENAAYTIRVENPAGTEEASEYVVSFTKPLSSDATLSSLAVGGTTVALEDGTYSYAVQLPLGTVKLPDVEAVANAAGAKVTIDMPSSTEGQVVVMVTSEDNNHNNSYTVQLSVEKSSDSSLSMIYADHKELANFSSTQTEYSYTVESGSSKPEISYQKGQEGQNVEVFETQDATTLKVTAEDGTATEYTINYTYSYSSEAGVSSIVVYGYENVFAFDQAITEYSIELPTGTTALPEIAVVPLDKGQETDIKNGGVRGDYVITATSEDGKKTVTYTIHFSVAKSTNAALNGIFLDGAELRNGASDKFTVDNDFSADITDYNVTLPIGTTSLPRVTAESGDVYQNVVIDADSEPNVVTITVTAEAGNTQTYTLDFTILKSTVATLNMIYVSGEELKTGSENFNVDKDFDPDTFEYNLELPVGANPLSYVYSYSAGDEYQTVSDNFSNNAYTIEVTAEDEAYANTYTVNVTVKKSDNAYLSDLTVNGLTIDGFAPEKLVYDIYLPVGTVSMPNVDYKLGDQFQTVSHSYSEDGSYHKISVTSQSGITNDYEVSFTVLKSDNANLASLRVSHNDASVQLSPAFDPEVYDYTVSLPYKHRDNLPAFVAVENNGQTLSDEHQPESADDSYSVTVTAEDGMTTQTYTVQLVLLPSDVSNLQMIYVDGEPLEGFEEATFSYDVELPYGTAECPEISWDFAEEGSQSAETETIATDNGWTVSIVVTAAAGNKDEYVIYFIQGKDSENRLSSLSAFGAEVEGFDPDVMQYFVSYPPYTDESVLPTVEDIAYSLVHETATATVSQSDVNTIVIQVVAENGDVRNYVLETVIEVSDNANLENIFISDKELEDFNPYVYEYYYMVAYGVNFIDESTVTYQTQEEAQTVLVYKDGMDVTLLVTAQDGSSQSYVIHFVPSSFNPTKAAELEDICVTSTADGYWKFTTKCNNVYLGLTDLSGRKIKYLLLPLVDPNVEDICSPNAEGYLYIPQGNEVLIYFFYSQGKVIHGGKIKTRN